MSLQEFFNNNATDELSKVQSQIDGVKEVMVQNIDKIIGRGEKIEMLVQKSEGLNDSALEVRKLGKLCLKIPHAPPFLHDASKRYARNLYVISPNSSKRLQKS